MKHSAVDCGFSGPDMRAFAKDLRPADKVSCVPVGERDLAPRRANIEDFYSATFDQIYSVLLAALFEQKRPPGSAR